MRVLASCVVGMLFLVGLMGWSASGPESNSPTEWWFTSAFGSSKRISWHDRDRRYGVQIGRDYEETFAECGAGSYVICFASAQLSIAIPRKPPALGDRWRVDRVDFEVVDILDKFSILGLELDGVYVLEGRFQVPLPEGMIPRCTFAAFSYTHGLVAFGTQERCERQVGAYVARSLPSLGASLPPTDAPPVD